MSEIKAIGGLPGAMQAGGPRPAAGSVAAGPGGEFAALLSQGLHETARTVGAAEQVSIAGLNGTASVQHVVEAVMQAEQRLQLAVSVRDKIVAAYLEVSRMQI